MTGHNLIKTILPILYLLLFFPIFSCGIYKKSDARVVSPNVDERVQQSIEEGRGFKLGSGMGKGGTTFEFASSNELWRATLEVLDFLPLTNVDYSGGIIITEWYNEGTSNDEAIKITVRFLSNEIRADGLNVVIHKKICNKFQQCTITKVQSSLEEEVKLAILKTATLLEKGKYKKNREKYIEKYGDKEPKGTGKKYGNN